MPAASSQADWSQATTESSSPVLLTFECDEDGQQHAESLHQQLLHLHPTLELVRAADLFDDWQQECNPMDFHGSVIAACAHSWRLQCQASHNSTKLVADLQEQLELLPEHASSYHKQMQDSIIEDVAFFIAAGERNVAADSQLLSRSFRVFLDQKTWPATALPNSWEASFRSLTSSQLDNASEPVLPDEYSIAARKLAAFVVSKAEPASELSAFLSVFKDSQQQWFNMLDKVDSDQTWQRATLAAFLISEQHELARLAAAVKVCKAELLVTLVINCSKFVVPGKEHAQHYIIHKQGSEVGCEVSLQLFAYASKHLQGRQIGLTEVLQHQQWCPKGAIQRGKVLLVVGKHTGTHVDIECTRCRLQCCA